MTTWLKRLVREDGGQDLIEYALLAALIALAATAAMQLLGQGVNGLFGKVNDKLAATP